MTIGNLSVNKKSQSFCLDLSFDELSFSMSVHRGPWRGIGGPILDL